MLIGGEELGGISIHDHIPEGDGVLMGLLLLEIVAASGATAARSWWPTCCAEVGPAQYARNDLRLARPLAKAEMTRRLTEDAPASIGGPTRGGGRADATA